MSFSNNLFSYFGQYELCFCGQTWPLVGCSVAIESEENISYVFTLASGLSWASAEKLHKLSKAGSERLRLEPKFSGL